MPTFNFYGRDKSGVAVNGVRQNQNADVLAQQLFSEGITPIKIEPAAEVKKEKKTSTVIFERKSISSTDLMMFSRQMYSLNKAGVPVVNSVTRLAETTTNNFFAKILFDIAGRLNSGESLSKALNHHRNVFPDIFMNMVQVGERTGHLTSVFEQLSVYLSLDDETKKKFKSALRYPAFVVLALLAAMVVINIFVIPAFAQLFTQYQAELPLMTRIILNTSTAMQNYWPQMLLGFIALTMFVIWYGQTEIGKMRYHTWQRKIPIIGSIVRRLHAVRFVHAFAMIFKTGVPITEGIQLAGKAVGNVYVAKKVELMSVNLARGASLTQVATQSRLFSPLVLQMLAVGEETGSVDNMLEEVADYYMQEINYDLAKLSETIEPILLIGMGIMVLVLALGVFLPMWDVARIVRAG